MLKEQILEKIIAMVDQINFLSEASKKLFKISTVIERMQLASGSKLLIQPSQHSKLPNKPE